MPLLVKARHFRKEKQGLHKRTMELLASQRKAGNPDLIRSSHRFLVDAIHAIS